MTIDGPWVRKTMLTGDRTTAIITGDQTSGKAENNLNARAAGVTIGYELWGMTDVLPGSKDAATEAVDREFPSLKGLLRNA
ncbi:MAG TPA: hypothetical protein EYP56_03180 [Planctomycetaceae bacterium]|nr:hypothetical protein [Planctomycetaceae bacterium]